MEKKRIKDATLEELNNFSKIADPITKFIVENWEGNLQPKGYEDFKADYEDYDGMGEPEYDLEFDGFNSATAGCGSIEDMLNLPNVTYGDTNQGRTPHDALVGGILGYGMQIGKARANKSIEKEMDRLQGDIVRSLGWIGKEGVNNEEIIKYIKDDLDRFKMFAIKYD